MRLISETPYIGQVFNAKWEASLTMEWDFSVWEVLNFYRSEQKKLNLTRLINN